MSVIDNKLSLHLVKTQSVLFGTKMNLSTGVKPNVICNGNVIASKSNVNSNKSRFENVNTFLNYLYYYKSDRFYH